jgi:hypothetical protein
VDIREGLLEQQVSLGWGIVALGVIAIFGWAAPAEAAARPAEVRSATGGERWRVRWKDVGRPASLARVPVLAVVAVTALVCSLSPERTIGTFTFVRPSALLYYVVPMFRSYARFGVVVQLMAVLLAGIGVDYLRRAGTKRAQIAWLALVALAASEYAVSPRALSRDVLPTAAHRWVVQLGDRARALDCTPFSQESQSVQWLTGSRVTVLGGAIGDCAEPDLSGRLAANGYTHLLVRRDTADGQWFAARPAPDGLRVAASFDNAQVFEVTAHTPAIHTAAMMGFFPRERNAEWTWQWMGNAASWTIVNTTGQTIVATLDVQLSAFHRARRLELWLDAHPVQTLVVEPPRRSYQIGPLTVLPGSHELAFHPVEGPTVARDAVGGNDPRPLSFAVGAWNWTVRSRHP